MSYLDEEFDYSNFEYVSTNDSLSLWSSISGQILLKHIELKPNLKVLDVGCGTGFPLIELAQRLGPTCEVTGLDPWKLAIERARQKINLQKIKNVKLVGGDASSMFFEDASFDMIVSNLGINIFRDREKVLGECGRVLKRDGSIVLTSNLEGQMSDFYEIYMKTLLELGFDMYQSNLNEFINHPVSISQVKKMFENTGFSIRQIHQEIHEMRFLNGTAMLNHHFIKTGFMFSWHQFLPVEIKKEVFTRLEKNLNEFATLKGELVLSFPIAYIEGIKT